MESNLCTAASVQAGTWECSKLQQIIHDLQLLDQHVTESYTISEFGLTKIYLCIVIISSTNKYRKHKSNMLIWVLPMDE